MTTRDYFNELANLGLEAKIVEKDIHVIHHDKVVAVIDLFQVCSIDTSNVHFQILLSDFMKRQFFHITVRYLMTSIGERGV